MSEACEHIPKACYSRIYLSVLKKIFPESDGKSFDNIWTKEIQSTLFGSQRKIHGTSRYVAGSCVDMSMIQDKADKKDFPDPLPIMIDSA
jgi:hypothetical protein